MSVLAGAAAPGRSAAADENPFLRDHLRAPPDEATPRGALGRQPLLATTAVDLGDPAAVGLVGGALDTARHAGFLGTLAITAPQATSYLIEPPRRCAKTRSPNG